jgi:hypothetical protein
MNSILESLLEAATFMVCFPPARPDKHVLECGVRREAALNNVGAETIRMRHHAPYIVRPLSTCARHGSLFLVTHAKF